jgi:hypothetical protein
VNVLFFVVKKVFTTQKQSFMVGGANAKPKCNPKGGDSE